MNSPTNSFDFFKSIKSILILVLLGRSCHLLWNLQFNDGLIMMGIAYLLISTSDILRVFNALVDAFTKMVDHLGENKDTTDENNKITLRLTNSIFDALINMERNMKTMVTYINRTSRDQSVRITMTRKNNLKEDNDLSQEELQELLNAALEQEDYLEAERLKKLMEK